jgi:hypothetical protein
MAFVRFMILMLIPLGVIYVSLLAYLCARKRDRLNAAYQPQGTDLARATFVKAGVSAYATRIRGKLAGVIFGIPFGLLAVHIFGTEFL